MSDGEALKAGSNWRIGNGELGPAAEIEDDETKELVYSGFMVR
jgi:hypothetical protein